MARSDGEHNTDKGKGCSCLGLDQKLESRESLIRTMPQCFKFSFGTKTTAIIDCFEIFIEKPTNLLARAQTFSSYKHNTIKVLIGITPQGTISYVSEASGGRTSDKFLTENCGILGKVVPGDMVMADRGFTIHESVAFKGAKLVIPAFTKGRINLTQLSLKQQGVLPVSASMWKESQVFYEANTQYYRGHFLLTFS